MAESSVVIATLGRPDHAASTAKQALEQGAGEVVVVDQSADALHQRLRAQLDPRARLIREAWPNLPNARNRGIEATSADLIVFFDDDVRLLPGCLEAHLRAFSDPGVGAVVGRIREAVILPNTTSLQNRVTWGGRVVSNLDHATPGRVQVLKGANMSVRRAALAGLSFDPAFEGTALLEDADISLALRAEGWEIAFAPDAALEHLSAPRGGVRVGSPFETERWRFHNTAYLLRKHRGWSAWVPARLTFTAIAAKRAWEWGDPTSARRLLAAFSEGWRRGSGSSHARRGP